MSAGKTTTMSSTVPPRSLRTADWPPMTLPLPGRAMTVVTPSARAFRNCPLSGPEPSGWMESMTRSWGVTGSLISLSSVTPPDGPRPRCECESMSPGVTTQPAASMTRAPSGTITSAPTSRIFPFAMSTVPLAISPLVTVRMRAFVIATTSWAPRLQPGLAGSRHGASGRGGPRAHDAQQAQNHDHLPHAHAFRSPVFTGPASLCVRPGVHLGRC